MQIYKIILLLQSIENILIRPLLSPENQHKKTRVGGFSYLLPPHYFLPPLTLLITKMINAMTATTRKMPQTIPALNIPETTEQLPRNKAKKQTIEEINNLILFR